MPVLYTAKYFLPCFLSSFFFFAFARVIFMRLNLINEKSMGGQFETLEYDSEEEGPNKAVMGPTGGSLEFVEIEMVSRV